jgi:hypothetical protein
MINQEKQLLYLSLDFLALHFIENDLRDQNFYDPVMMRTKFGAAIRSGGLRVYEVGSRSAVFIGRHPHPVRAEALRKLMVRVAAARHAYLRVCAP